MFRFKIPRISRENLDIFRFTFYLMTPIGVMYYVGTNTDEKFNVPGFWPDPNTLNKIPKESYEIKAELARMRAERLEKRKRLEEKAKELGIEIDED